MKGFETLHVKSAVKSHNKFDLSRTHLTTGDFGQITPLFCEETVPGDKFTIDANYFSRMAPLAKPTYGKFSFHTMAGYVPYYQVADDAEAYIAGKTTWEGATPVLRYITPFDIFLFVKNYCTESAATAGDFNYLDASGNPAYANFTNVGRFYVKVLNALGYSLPEGADQRSNGTWRSASGAGSMKLSAYPLLAFFKLYNDWCSQSQRYNSSNLTSILRKIKHGISVSGYTPSTGHLEYNIIAALFQNLKLNYENDYFTSAWQNPANPLGANESVQTLKVPAGDTSTTTADSVQNVYRDTFLYEKTETVSSTNYSVIGQRALDFLKSFDDWVRRNNYSGSRVVQQVYSRFGIKTSDFRDNYAEVIKTDVSPIQIGDVTSQSDATGAVLGDYAGKGIVSDGKTISYEAKDFGMLFILGWFTVAPMNAFGMSRHCLRNQPLDWYNPEFDGIGADVISYGEVYEDPTLITGDSSTSLDVYGFTERYNAYRFGRDQITGDFRDFNQVGMNVWHAGRYLTDLRKTRTMVAQSSAMNTLAQTDSEYNRIFNVTTGDVDHFYLTCQFGVSAVRPMLNLNQVPRLGEGDTNVSRNGNTIN